MWRSLSMLLLPAALTLLAPTTADASLQAPLPPGWGSPGIGDLSGMYSTNQGPASVQRRGRNFVFTNPSGSQAVFMFVGPGRLEQVTGSWDPSVVATVSRDRQGRIVIRFDSPNAPSGYWVSAY